MKIGYIRVSTLEQNTARQEIIMQKSGVKKIKIHDFRHSHASYLIANGMNIVAVSKRLGHSDVNMTLKVYTHLFKKNDDEITEFLDKSWIGGGDNYTD